MAMVIGLVATVLASLTDNEFLQILIFVVAAVATMYAGNGFSFDNISGFDAFLKTADASVKAYNKVENMQVATAVAISKEEAEALAEENDELQEEIKAMRGVNSAIYIKDYSMDIASTPPGGIIDPETYFMQKYGGSLYDFDSLFDIDSVYDMKKNVKV